MGHRARLARHGRHCIHLQQPGPQAAIHQEVDAQQLKGGAQARARRLRLLPQLLRCRRKHQAWRPCGVPLSPSSPAAVSTREGHAALHSSEEVLRSGTKTLQALVGQSNCSSSAPDMPVVGGMAMLTGSMSTRAAAPTQRCMAAQSPSNASREPVAFPR